MRNWLRNQLFRLVRRLFATDEGRDIVAAALPGRVPSSAAFRPDSQLLGESPYPDIPTSIQGANDGEGAVFITGRFRSGSTLLWNLFRHLPGHTAYYEPLNERRWFDPARRGEHVDQTHKHVQDYWREYDGLNELSGYYRDEWTRRDLFMPAGAWNPGLKRYVEILIERASGRAVLQFNRVDFRLPWLRSVFPKAKVVHLFRHPRDQWLSTLQRSAHFPLHADARQFGPYDMFYLLTWARDLKGHFPLLDERLVGHPYELFYLIWKLSYMFGRQYSDVSLSFEQLVQEPHDELQRLFEVLSIDATVDDRLLRLVERPKLGRWTEYADGNWFAQREAKCERSLAEFFATSSQSHPVPMA